jgi:hypothetical protein
MSEDPADDLSEGEGTPDEVPEGVEDNDPEAGSDVPDTDTPDDGEPPTEIDAPPADIDVEDTGDSDDGVVDEATERALLEGDLRATTEERDRLLAELAIASSTVDDLHNQHEAEVAALREEHDSFVTALRDEHEDAVAAHAATVESLRAELAELAAERDEAKAAIAAIKSAKWYGAIVVMPDRAVHVYLLAGSHIEALQRLEERGYTVQHSQYIDKPIIW